MSEELGLPQGVSGSFSGRVLTLKGPKGEASRHVSEHTLAVVAEPGKVSLRATEGGKRDKKLLGSLRAHVLNMVHGVSEGHIYRLKVCYTHFPVNVSVSGNKLVVKNFLGEKTPRELEFPKNVKVEAKGADVVVESASKETAGMIAGAIEQLTKRANYDRRVFGDGIYITAKDGKDIK